MTSRLRPEPGPRYVHPKSLDRPADEGQHDANLDLAGETASEYLNWITELIDPRLGHRVLEVGAGTGTITARYANGREVLASDLSDYCVASLRERFADAPNIDVEQKDVRELGSLDRSFDSALMVNVLEHIQDDSGVLRDLAELIVPGGNIVIYVPALNGLYGTWDRKVGHFRRYSKWRMREVARDAGLTVEQLRYVNMLAIPGWVAFSRANNDSTGTVSNTLSLWDRVGVPVTRAIESRVPVPLGLNLLAVLRRS